MAAVGSTPSVTGGVVVPLKNDLKNGKPRELSSGEAAIKSHDPTNSPTLKDRGTPTKAHWGFYFEVGPEYTDTELLAYYDWAKVTIRDKHTP